MNRSVDKYKSQKKIISIGVVVLAVAVLCIIWYSVQTEYLQKGSLETGHSMDLPSDREDSQKIWMNQVEEDSKNLSNKLQQLENTLLQDRQNSSEERKRLEEMISEYKKGHDSVLEEKKILEQEIAKLKNDLSAQGKFMKESLTRKAEEAVELKNAPGGFEKPPIKNGESAKEEPVVAEEEVPLPLSEWVIEKAAVREKIKNVDEVIPAGTTVRALLVSSVDAPCGVNSSSDPQPVKLRVLDNAHLPKDVRSMLKGALIIGSAYGNISSERVYMRMERMSKIEINGDFVETEIAAYVSGEDGRYGMRGIVVDKSYKMIARAGFSGFLGGLTQYLQSTINAQNIAKASRGMPNDVQWDVLRSSGLQGFSNALEKLADYQIRRAEQLSPVIQVGAGRIVDVTFTHGVRIGDLNVKNRVKEVRERSRKGGEVHLFTTGADSH